MIFRTHLPNITGIVTAVMFPPVRLVMSCQIVSYILLVSDVIGQLKIVNLQTILQTSYMKKYRVNASDIEN